MNLKEAQAKRWEIQQEINKLTGVGKNRFKQRRKFRNLINSRKRIQSLIKQLKENL